MPNYSGRIIANTLAESKNGKPSVKLQIRTDRDLDSGNSTDRTFYADLWLTDKAAEKSIETLREIGFQGDDLKQLNDPVLEGSMVEISTVWENYNGKDIEKVAYVNKVGSYANRGLKSLDPNKADKFAQKYNAMLRNKPKQAPAPKAETNNGEGDDDLPF